MGLVYVDEVTEKMFGFDDKDDEDTDGKDIFTTALVSPEFVGITSPSPKGFSEKSFQPISVQVAK